MTLRQKPKDLIKKYSTAIVEGLESKIRASSSLNHKLTKGELRELFVSTVLRSFLSSQFDVGTGIVVNQREQQSNQMDIILYDNRILPPFIKEQHIGVYPAESVLGTIEVKSRLTKQALLEAEASAKRLHEEIFDPRSSIYKDYDQIKPISGIIAFYGRGVRELSDATRGADWLTRNVRYIFAICLLGRFSWLNLSEKGWLISQNPRSYEETKRFIAVYLDNLRTISETRVSFLGQFAHEDWLSIYTRDQELFDSYSDSE